MNKQLIYETDINNKIDLILLDKISEILKDYKLISYAYTIYENKRLRIYFEIEDK